MDDSKNKLLDKIKSSNAILVTVSRNPTVDQLAGCISFALLINKLNKSGSALYSGQTPSTIEFLKPENTLEKNTDSLQDFIISLDKNKADKLRTKVDDQSVKIFITPYKTSLNESDLEFSQGDFNIDLIIALGVYKKEELDTAITNHGGILHDATIATITIGDPSELGSINWNNPNTSSFCELIASTVKVLGSNLLDNQIATALLTGIVSETNRFSNDKTTSQTMSVSAELMNAGANPKLIASELRAELSNTDSGINLSDQSNSADVQDTLNIDHDLDELLGTNNGQSDSIELPSPSEEIAQPESVGYDSNQGDEQDSLKSTAQINKYPTQPEVSATLNEALQVADSDPSVEQTTQNTPAPESPSAFPSPTVDDSVQSLTSSDGSDEILNQTASSSTDQTGQMSGVNDQQQPFTPPPPDWQAPPLGSNEPAYPPISTNHAGASISEAPNNAVLDDARNNVATAFGQDEAPSGAPILPPSQSANPDIPADSDSDVGQPSSEAPNNGANDLTGLDPSLFSEPKKQDSDNSAAPPVPPPVVQLPFTNDNSSNDNLNN